LDIEGNITLANKAVKFKIGFEEDELTGVNIDILFANGRQSFFKNAVKRMNLKDSSRDFDFTFYFAKKSYPSICTFNRLFSEVNEHIGYTLIVKDLSNLKRAEEMVQLSEQKYRKLFEESGDGIVISNGDGCLLEANAAALKLFGLAKSGMVKYCLSDFILHESDRKKIRKYFRIKEHSNNLKLVMKNNSTGSTKICLITVSKLSTLNEYQIVLKDVTHESEIENLVIRTIVDTQENERIRFSRDIHDSLGQQLSAIKFYLSTLSSSHQLNEKNQQLIEKSENGLNTILTNLREICFNLMPKTIENFGLLAAVHELCKNIQSVGKLEFKISAENDFPRLSQDKEIAIFRIIQEFINNSIKHASAKNIEIIFRFNDSDIFVLLKDDGIGFDIDESINKSGMGLKNIFSRARSYNGNLKISSESGKGTIYDLMIPVENIKVSEIK
jgi:PAS domain S-box-containing protein